MSRPATEQRVEKKATALMMDARERTHIIIIYYPYDLCRLRDIFFFFKYVPTFISSRFLIRHIVMKSDEVSTPAAVCIGGFSLMRLTPRPLSDCI